MLIKYKPNLRPGCEKAAAEDEELGAAEAILARLAPTPATYPPLKDEEEDDEPAPPLFKRAEGSSTGALPVAESGSRQEKKLP